MGYNVDCITFGSPRVGDKNFTDLFNQRIINRLRIVGDDDLVTAFPPRFNGYEHVSPVVRFLEDGTITFREKSIWENIHNGCLTFCRGQTIEEHIIESYIEKIDYFINQ